MYPEQLVIPMKAELTSLGFEDLTTPEKVDAAIRDTKGTVLVVVNSVCGCAAGAARPAVKMAMSHEKKPAHLATVFAGFDTEATAQARKYFAPYPPSSPCMALFKLRMAEFVFSACIMLTLPHAITIAVAFSCGHTFYSIPCFSCFRGLQRRGSLPY